MRKRDVAVCDQNREFEMVDQSRALQKTNGRKGASFYGSEMDPRTETNAFCRKKLQPMLAKVG